MAKDALASIADLIQIRPLPELAAAVRSRVPQILTRWEEQVRDLLPAADKLTFGQLRDGSLAMLGQLADAVATADAAATAVLIESAREHAAVRFDEQYNLQELITEYALLRRTAVEEVESALARNMSGAEQVTLHLAIDAMLGRAVMAFAGHQQVRLRAAAEKAEQAAAIAEAASQATVIAQAANKAKADFLAVLSHELRAPLTPVLTTAAMLHKDPRFDADTRQQLEVICRNAELEARLIDDLLDVTRIERGKVELHRRPVALCTILRQAAESCRADMETRKLEFSIDIADEPYVIDADPTRLLQVFWNLLNNAVKFTPAGGCVRVRCRRDGDGCVITEVSDNGEGIAAEVLPLLFKAFEQGGRPTTRQFGGLGLGLTIARAMIELHGGTIAAHSAGKGKGATFTIRLPLMPPEAAVAADLAGSASLSAASSATPPAPARAPAPLRILLVEDHGDTARIMRRVLSAKGHKVEIAGDVAMALNLVGEHSFDLVLSDLGLPDGSGWDLMRALRKRGLTLPGIALSGYGQDEDLRQSREAGFATHLVKPVNMSRLDEAIAKAVGHAAPVARAE